MKNTILKIELAICAVLVALIAMIYSGFVQFEDVHTITMEGHKKYDYIEHYVEIGEERFYLYTDKDYMGTVYKLGDLM